MKAFLSHSSEDKDFLQVIFDELGDSAIYDKKSFIPGHKNNEEMANNIAKSDLFVYFISNNSLSSESVKFECDMAMAYNKKILPIIIDDTDISDERINLHIKKLFNIGKIKGRRKIIALIRSIFYELGERQSIKDSIFIGRNGEIGQIEDFLLENKKPKCIIANGLSDTGRKTTVYHALKKVLEINTKDYIINISLSQLDNIDSFYERLKDASFENYSIQHFVEQDLEEKLNEISFTIHDLIHSGFYIFLNDDNCIVHHGGIIEKWFLTLLDKIDSFGLVIISTKKPLRVKEIKSTEILLIEIGEIERKYRNILLDKYLEAYNVPIKENEYLDFIKEHLSGSMSQIDFVANLIKENNVKRVFDKYIREIDSYDRIKALTYIDIYINKYNNDIVDLLRLLAAYPFVSFSFIEKIQNKIGKPLLDYVDIFLNDSVCLLEGVYKEYVRVNDVIACSLKRLQPISNFYIDLLEENAVKFSENYDKGSDEYDLSETRIYIAKLLQNGNIKRIESILTITNFMQAIRDSYYEKKDFDQVIFLAQKVLERVSESDSYIEQDARYFLCLSLAKKKNNAFLDIVRSMKRDGERHFLYGFYYRQIRDYKKAIEYQRKAMLSKSSEPRARKELVMLLCYLERFDEAYELAEQNYKRSPENPLYAQDYFICSYNKQNDIKIAKKVIDGLSLNKSEKSIEIQKILTAKMNVLFYNDYEKAYDIIDSIFSEYPKNTFAYVEELNIALKEKNRQRIEHALQFLEDISDINYVNIQKAKIMLRAFDGKLDEALLLAKSKLTILSDRKIEEFIKELYNISH